MTCHQCQGIERTFEDERAKKELDAYHKSGPAKSTRVLLEALQAADLADKTLLDIGGGVGVLQHELVRAGVRQVVSVEASSAYLKIATEEAERQGYADNAQYYAGDFVTLASRLEHADIVTLDRVLCCYHDATTLVNLSAARAGMLYGLVYPPDTWWMKLYTRIANLIFRLKGNPFRLYVHKSETVEAVVRANGLRRCFYRRVGTWQVSIYKGC